MKGGSILRHSLSTGVDQFYEVESIELGATGEIGLVFLKSISLEQTIDGSPVEISIPSNMVYGMIEKGMLTVYNKVEE